MTHAFLRPAALLAAASLLLAAGCATSPSGDAPGAPAGAPAGSTASPSIFGGLFGTGLSPALDSQRSRLRDVLQGTPVVIEATEDKRLRIEVPTRFAFDPGRSAVKPALAAVLDQLASGFKPHAAVNDLRIGAPTDDKPSPRLVDERAASVRDYLVGRGVPISRVVGLGGTERPGLELVVSDRAR